MALQSSDLLLVERGGVLYQMVASDVADFLGAVRDHSVADITARDALTDVSVGDRVFVADASADATVDSGWAIYRVQTTGPITYFKIQEGEGLDVVAGGGSNLGYTAAAGQGTVTNDGGTAAVIPVVDAVNAGLATPSMFSASHSAASAGGTAQTNPVVVNAGTQQVTFNITQLTALP